VTGVGVGRSGSGSSQESIVSARDVEVFWRKRQWQGVSSVQYDSVSVEFDGDWILDLRNGYAHMRVSRAQTSLHIARNRRRTHTHAPLGTVCHCVHVHVRHKIENYLLQLQFTASRLLDFERSGMRIVASLVDWRRPLDRLTARHLFAREQEEVTTVRKAHVEAGQWSCF